MLIIIDKRIPEIAKKKLSHYGEVVEFETNGIVYDSISCHPDIFFCQTSESLIVAPDCPERYIKLLYDRGIKFKIGQSRLGNTYPETAKYNAVAVKNFLIHNIKNTDNKIIEQYNNREDVILINVRQSYTRCNLIEINNLFLTSDMGIFLKLKATRLNVFYVNPEGIFLHGHANGFFGGCCGTFGGKIFIIGSLQYINKSSKLTDILTKNKIEVIELADGQLIDGGGILFIEQ